LKGKKLGHLETMKSVPLIRLFHFQHNEEKRMRKIRQKCTRKIDRQETLGKELCGNPIGRKG
jgi:hypothetical protein